MTALSKRQQRLARKANQGQARPASPSAPRQILNAVVETEEPVGALALATAAERHAVRVAIQQAEDLAAREGRTLSQADRRAIRADHGVDIATDARNRGQIRMKGRDGLVSLNTAGRIGDDLLQAGLAYRQCMEVAASGLRSGLANPEGGGRTMVAGFALPGAAALHRSYVMARLAQMDRAVAAITVDGREVQMLRMIAGEGRTLTSIASGGNAQVAALKALIAALTAVARVLPIGIKRDGLVYRDQGGLRIRTD
tara:strand:- start:6911 stop:7675 length:765 start_codon:yes stop_codon:yes gene_type:complete